MTEYVQHAAYLEEVAYTSRPAPALLDGQEHVDIRDIFVGGLHPYGGCQVSQTAGHSIRDRLRSSLTGSDCNEIVKRLRVYGIMSTCSCALPREPAQESQHTHQTDAQSGHKHDARPAVYCSARHSQTSAHFARPGEARRTSGHLSTS